MQLHRLPQTLTQLQLHCKVFMYVLLISVNFFFFFVDFMGAFRPVDRLLCSETGINLLHFLLGSVRFHKATLQSIPNCV